MKKTLVLTGVTIALLALEPVLVHAMARGHIAHVLLASGGTSPPIAAASLAIALVLTRLFAIVLAPGLLLGAAVYLAAPLLKPSGGAR